jgi:transcriptional regulator with XRE-family HTH domain
MMRFDDVMAALQRCKGGGAWAAIAEKSGVHYDTVARIARGKMSAPGVLVVEKIADAICELGLDKAEA